MYAPDDMMVDRGRKTKLKPKTQSRYSVENSTSTVEHQPQQHYHRPGKKERSKSRDSKERSKKHPLSESVSGEKSGANSESTSSLATTELSRMKKELETFKKVRSSRIILFVHADQLL
jgi:hypothetical protein